MLYYYAFPESERQAGTQEGEWSELVNIVKNLDSDFTTEKTCDSIIEWKT